MVSRCAVREASQARGGSHDSDHDTKRAAAVPAEKGLGVVLGVVQGRARLENEARARDEWMR